MVGFFSYVRILSKCNTEVLAAGKDYKQRFDNNSITTAEYEAEMIGKIYEIATRNACGKEELEKRLKSEWADLCVKYLKETIDLYEEVLINKE